MHSNVHSESHVSEAIRYMASRSFPLQSNLTHSSPTFTCSLQPPPHCKTTNQRKSNAQCSISRRIGTIAASSSILLTAESISWVQAASGFEFKFAVPDQTIEEAESEVRGHAQALIEIRDLLESESWTEAQKALRQSSSYLKQDLYTIIQAKPGIQRPALRKLYSDLFNSASRLDYAARDKDAARVWQCYGKMVAAVNEFLSRIV